MFAYYSSASANGSQLFGWLLCETAIAEFTAMLFVYSLWAAEFGWLSRFLANSFRALRDEGRLRANEGSSNFATTRDEGEHNVTRAIKDFWQL